ncbi:hypothetical protein IGI37_000166 [Enterococcus sp. AZ194]|uniref:serine hydrolase domain-containing protein n=1 Tax=Enterococcus sp. AZ194 TaxID=2774629 RepID=UPI003F28AE62
MKMIQQLTDFLQQTEVSGLSAAVLNQKTEKFLIGKMGKSQPYSDQEVSDESLYDLASLTKVVGTTTRIIQMIQEKQLSYDTVVSTLLPQFPNLSMTIEELLFHRSGLPADFSDKKHFSEDLAIDFLKNFTPSMTDYPIVYSDIGYLLLGFVIEEIEGTDLETSFQKHLFQPLGMKDTTFFPKDLSRIMPTEISSERGLIHGVVHDSKAYRFGRPIGSAGLFSTLNDLIIFTEALMNNRLGEADWFEPKIYQILLKSEQGRTWGWEKPFGPNVLYHTGFAGTSIGLDIQKHKAFILLSNRVHPTRETPKFITERFKLYQEFFKENDA